MVTGLGAMVKLITLEVVELIVTSWSSASSSIFDRVSTHPLGIHRSLDARDLLHGHPGATLTQIALLH